MTINRIINNLCRTRQNIPCRAGCRRCCRCEENREKIKRFSELRQLFSRIRDPRRRHRFEVKQAKNRFDTNPITWRVHSSLMLWWSVVRSSSIAVGWYCYQQRSPTSAGSAALCEIVRRWNGLSVEQHLLVHSVAVLTWLALRVVVWKEATDDWSKMRGRSEGLALSPKCQVVLSFSKHVRDFPNITR